MLDHAVVHLCHGTVRVKHELRLTGVRVSTGGIRGVWQRHDLLTKHERLLRLEKATADWKGADYSTTFHPDHSMGADQCVS